MTPMPPDLIIQGQCDPRFAAVREAFAENFALRGEVGASVAVTVEGALVVDLWAGHADAARSQPWTRDTLVNVYSVTKGMAATCVHLLVDRGLLDLDAPVARYWPEFGRAGKEAIRVRWLLSHRAGVPAVERALPSEMAYDWDGMCAELVAQKPWWEPGRKHGYHAFTFSWLVGEVVRRISGKSLGRFLMDEVSSPLGIDAHIGCGPDLDARIADLLPSPPPPPPPSGQTDPFAALLADRSSLPSKALNNPPIRRGQVNTREWRAAELPAANGHSNARAVARLYAMLANGGQLDGVRILRPETIENARTEQSAGVDAVLGRENRFALGFSLPSPAFQISKNLRAFGNVGLGGALGFADPEARMSFGYAMNQMAVADPGGDARWWGLLHAVDEAL